MEKSPVTSFLLVKIKKIDQDLKLPYLQRIYIDLTDQSSSNIYYLRKNNEKVRLKNGRYQLLLSEKKISSESKKAIIKKILNMKCKDNISLEEHIENWFVKSIVAIGFIDNQYKEILDILATYFITTGKDISILTDKKLKKIDKYEVAAFTDKVDDSYKTYKWFEIKKIGKKELNKYYDNNKKKTKKWKNTYTYKINKIKEKYKTKLAAWVYVDNTGIFDFDNKKFAIKNEPKYKLNANRQSDMDSILCIKDIDNDYYFYNMDLVKIDKTNIYPIISCK